MLGAVGQVATFGLFDGGQFGGHLGDDVRGELGGVEQAQVRARAWVACSTLVPIGWSMGRGVELSVARIFPKASRSCCRYRPRLCGPCRSAVVAGCV